MIVFLQRWYWLAHKACTRAMDLQIYHWVQKHPHNLNHLTTYMSQPQLPSLTWWFIYDQLHPDGLLTSNNVNLEACPQILSKMLVFHSAVAMFFSPSDPSRSHGMRHERIESTPSWHGHPQRDCVLVVEDDSQEGFSMSAVHVLLFFSFTHQQEKYPYKQLQYPCTLVEWLKKVGDSPDPKTSMWIVKLEYCQWWQVISVIHIDSLYRWLICCLSLGIDLFLIGFISHILWTLLKPSR